MAAEATAEGEQINGGPVGGTLLVATSSENFISKRKRRPSVRLGEIGGGGRDLQTYGLDSHIRRNQAAAAGGKLNNHHSQINPSAKALKTRPLMNLAGGSTSEIHETHFEKIDSTHAVSSDLDGAAIGSWKVNKDVKSRRGLGLANAPATKRVRSNWVSKVNGGGDDDVDNKFSEDFENDDDEFREFDHEGSESPIRSTDIRRQVRGRASSEGHDRAELSGDADWRCGDGNGESWRMYHEDGGVRSWLNGLGLGRYAPVFEIHEVDDEVLPLLTLEDLKDMGINAVGSRRKMFCAIQKLGKGFS